ncbi:hypothetical protein F66182_7027 [Fusarium sp. NRRL 66182]|nr:hypothetical protein F66182_7027 [Fusarium sp. NRRL 66182]
MPGPLCIRSGGPKPIIVAAIIAGGLGTGLVLGAMLGDASAEPNQIFRGGFVSVSLPLESSEAVNHNTKRLRFKLPRDTATSGLPLTSALLAFPWPKGNLFPTPRPYTPISASDEPGYVELIVKKYPNGRGSGYLHSLNPGDKLYFATTLPGYSWKPNSYPHITLIAGGCGISPIFQLAQGILRNPQDKTSMTLVFGARSDEDVLLRKELDQFAKEFPDRFRAVYTVSNPEEGSQLRKGYVDKELLDEVLPLEKRNTKVFVCGPPAMEASLVGNWSSGVLGQLGFQRKQIHKF